MSKYINIVLLSFFGVLSIKFNMGLSFYIPFVIYYTYKNIKNIILIIPFSIFSIYFFNIKSYIIFIILYITLIPLMALIKENKKIFIFSYCLLINIIVYYIYKSTYNINNNIYLDILSIIISPIILMFLVYNNQTSSDLNKEIKSIIYNEFILGVVLCIGSTYYKILDIPISFIVAIYFSMYLSSNKYIFSSILYSFMMMFYIHTFVIYDYSLIIIFISFIYLIPNIFSSITLILLLIYILYFKNNILPLNLFYMLGIVTIVFEILRPFIINKKNQVEVVNNIYERTMSQIEIDIDSFSLFLDKVSQNITNNEYNEEMGNAISKISQSVCNKCERRNDCYQRNRSKVYFFFKNCLLNNEDDFICEKKDQIKRYARSLSNALTDKKQYINDVLYPILNSVSNILKQYKVDHSLNTEINFNQLNDLKEGLLNYGYSISLFNVIRTFKNDYIIEIGIIVISYYDEKENIENVCSHYLENLSTCNLKDIIKNKTYVTIIPKTNFDISYGYGSISKVGNSICGDNYLVKDLSNKKFISVICDGMGKGLNANIISSRTLRLLDDITNTNISGETSIQILNSLYYIQDYQENYTTMDYTEIDKHTGEMLMYKAGATYSYIIHSDNTFEKIENEHLPFGLNEYVSTKKIQLKDQDLVLLASDGIFDNVINLDAFENFILSIKNLEPQKISYELLNYARHTDLIAKDDMSVVVLKIKQV